MTFVQAFDKIKERLDGKAKISAERDFFAVQVELTNKDCSGIFYVKYENGVLDVQPYDYMDNTAAISVSYLTFNKLIDGRLDPEDAIKKGTILAAGDASVIGALSAIVPAEKKETPKKAAPKKETPKNEAPKKEAPKKETPKKETPKKEAPKKAAPKAAAKPAKK